MGPNKQFVIAKYYGISELISLCAACSEANWLRADLFIIQKSISIIFMHYSIIMLL